MKIQSPRGTEDVLPDDSPRWQHLERVFKTLANSYGYGEIRTPTFEETSLFVRSVGDTSDIVTKEMYEFKDKGDRSMTLKPEGTAGAMRALIQHSLCPPGHVSRLYYITPIFRYERPQKGRLRESHQVGLELVGSSSPMADAEIIEMTYRFYFALGFPNPVVNLNSIGRAECRQKFKDEILSKMSGFLVDQTEEFKAKVNKNPLRLLDSKDESVQGALSDLRPITDFLEDKGREDFEALQGRLSERSVSYQLNSRIVRGLDYYTDTVFEVLSNHVGSQNSLCGGGRYDDLVHELGGASTPSVGVAMGIERALITMEEIGLAGPGDRPKFFGIVADPAARKILDGIADSIRTGGSAVVFDLEDRNLKNQLKQAVRCRARFALIMGEEEVKNDQVTVRNLDSGDQCVIATKELISTASSLE